MCCRAGQVDDQWFFFITRNFGRHITELNFSLTSTDRRCFLRNQKGLSPNGYILYLKTRVELQSETRKQRRPNKLQLSLYPLTNISNKYWLFRRWITKSNYFWQIILVQSSEKGSSSFFNVRMLQPISLDWRWYLKTHMVVKISKKKINILGSYSVSYLIWYLSRKVVVRIREW